MRVKTRLLSPEVLVAEEPTVPVSRADVQELTRAALGAPRRRARLCAHGDVSDPLHEMLIVHTREAYVRPHRHVSKPESVHVFEGAADLVFLTDDGDVQDVVCLGDYASGRVVYCRISEGYHTLLIRSDVFVFHESTTGPFRREDTLFAPWSPQEESVDDVADYRAALETAVRSHESHRS